MAVVLTVSSLVVELRDDTKESSYEAMGLGTYSNRKEIVLSYVSIFESLWKQSELYEELKIRDKVQTEFINIELLHYHRIAHLDYIVFRLVRIC
jgi:two-component system, OmpR family, sensor histidine kinase VicK